MKTLQKYANMAFLLLSVATIVPTYTHQEDIVEQKNTETVWYKKPAVIGGAITVATLATLFAAWYTNTITLPERLTEWLNYMGAVSVGWTQPIKKQPIEQTTNCLSNVIVFGEIVQTNGKDTIITPGRNPISIKQDSTGTWIKKNNIGPWTLI